MEWWRLPFHLFCLLVFHSLSSCFPISSTGWDLHVNIWTRHLQKENESLVLNLILLASFCSLCWRLYSWNNVSIGKDCCCCCCFYRFSSCCLLYCSSWRFPTPCKFFRRCSLHFPASKPVSSTWWSHLWHCTWLHQTMGWVWIPLNWYGRVTLIKISQ